jgi:hypothetical protein
MVRPRCFVSTCWIHRSGNLKFRRFTEAYRERYKQASKVDKTTIAAEVVAAWRNLDPPGRFLTRTDSSTSDSFWCDVGDAHAVKRATKTLGERSQRERRAQKAAKVKTQGDLEQGCSSAPSSPCSLYTTASEGGMSDKERSSPQNCRSALQGLPSKGSQPLVIPSLGGATYTHFEASHVDMTPAAFVAVVQQQMKSTTHLSGSRSDMICNGLGLGNVEFPTAATATERTSQSMDIEAEFSDGCALRDKRERNSGESARTTRSFASSQQEAEVLGYIRCQDEATTLWNAVFGGPVDTSSSNGNDTASAVWDMNSVRKNDSLSGPHVASLDIPLTGADLFAASSVPTAAFLAQCAFDDEDDGMTQE